MLRTDFRANGVTLVPPRQLEIEPFSAAHQHQHHRYNNLHRTTASKIARDQQKRSWGKSCGPTTKAFRPAGPKFDHVGPKYNPTGPKVDPMSPEKKSGHEAQETILSGSMAVLVGS